MSSDPTERAAQILFAARRHGRQIDALPDDCRPRDRDEAYAIQDRLLGLLGAETAGWFLGGTSAESRRMLQMPEPYAARLISSTVCRSPAVLNGDSFFSRGIDVEFAFLLGADLVPGEQPFTSAEVADAVDTLVPAIDMVNSHYRDWSNLDWPSVVADNGTDGVIILGTPIKDWRGLDLPAMQTGLTVDGLHVASGSGAEVLGDPLAALTWLANHVVARGDWLRAGQLVVTGSSTKIYFALARAGVVATFAGLGDVALRFT